MSKSQSVLDLFRNASTLADFSSALNVEAKSIGYLFYRMPDSERYKSFKVPKKDGGEREIYAPIPAIGTIQKRLNTLLRKALEEIRAENNRFFPDANSHGFELRKTIVTNALNHASRRYVFNIDIEDFFGSISFPRIYGMLQNKNGLAFSQFSSKTIAQICCHRGFLPQGSPLSPFVSNLFGYILDSRIKKLVKPLGLAYTRYADDLTFSTNKATFPPQIAEKFIDENGKEKWQVAITFKKRIETSGFNINKKKTRMQFSSERQIVTGLVVNSYPNIDRRVYKQARAMVHSILKNGSCKKGPEPYSIKQLEGLLWFIYKVKNSHSGYNMSKIYDPKMPTFARWHLYFLLHKHLFANSMPVIITEGKTDHAYVKMAIRYLSKNNTLDAVFDQVKSKHKVSFLDHGKQATQCLLNSGGTSNLKNLLSFLDNNQSLFLFRTKFPVIFLVDDDKAGQSDVKHFNGLKKIPQRKFFITTTQNNSIIEDLFTNDLRSIPIEGKNFTPQNSGYDSRFFYGKNTLLEKVIVPKRESNIWEGFLPVVASIQEIISRSKIDKGT